LLKSLVDTIIFIKYKTVELCFFVYERNHRTLILKELKSAAAALEAGKQTHNITWPRIFPFARG
jgi:hypothetical protein